MTIHQSSAALAASLLVTLSLSAQTDQPIARAESPQAQTVMHRPPAQKVVIVTGVRFSYKLIEKWIDEYNKVNSDVQIVVESRGSADPPAFDIVAEVYEPEASVKEKREYVYVARYAILPVANAVSSFAKVYADKGLNTELINQVFFNDILADKDKQKAINTPFTVYTRLQKAGVPAVFSEYFGYRQMDIKGKAIAGADTHLVKALLRDSTGVTYLPTPLIYDDKTRKPIEGLTVLPVDLNGNGRVTDNEKFYDTIDKVVEHLEPTSSGEIKNVPLGYLHLSVARENANPEATKFLQWIKDHGQDALQELGYLKPEKERL